ncbi:hypothetical protein [Aliikangiella sp. IMCC44359]|uniref:hypothetical protein n=1 Tax=Aliikangiella sp. IMCC44359 TaxID=3459125 RepID=UPI00403B0D5B
MFNFSIKKCSGLVILMGSLLAGNAWAGCDIDYVRDTKENSSLAKLIVKFDSKTGECAESNWDSLLFRFLGKNGLKVKSDMPFSLRKENNRFLDTQVSRGETITVIMFVRNSSSGMTRQVDSAVERIQ